MESFSRRVATAVTTKNSCLMLGLDPVIMRLPGHLSRDVSGVETFCREMIDATKDIVCGVKIQMAYFEVFGSEGMVALERLLAYMREQPNLITLMDAKRGDIGSTSEAYAKAYLGDSPLSCDAMTVSPYLGEDAIKPFIDLAKANNRGVFLLLKTSNPDAAQFQGDPMNPGSLSLLVADMIARERVEGDYSPVGAVIGATNEGELALFRSLLPGHWFLCPGVGTQGGKIEDVLAAQDDVGLGTLIPVSRSVLYASNGEDFATAGREEMQKLVNQMRAGSVSFTNG